MNYIIFDLEWNNAYNYRTGKGFNEIVEIGAVKLDDKLNIVDTFKQLIKPKISKKLSSRFKTLTHITNEEINSTGLPFDAAFKEFSAWCGKSEKVFLSWSNNDLYTLANNFKNFKDDASIDFMDNYADAQKYCMSFIEKPDNNQISLAHYAQLIDIDIENIEFHRALEDCYITAYCFQKMFNKNKFASYIQKCDRAFFERLVFKPTFLNKPITKDFNIYDEKIECSLCGGEIKIVDEYEFKNNTFKNWGKCVKCKKKFWVFVRAKRTYDGIVVSKRLVEMNIRKANKIK